MSSLATLSPRAGRSDAPPLRALGAVLAGGASRRYGGTKALAEVGGVALVERVHSALRAAVSHPVIITHLPSLAELAGLPARPDATGAGGPLAGIDTALRWAAELDLPGALCIACDMPFLTPSLLREIVREGVEGHALALVPESGSGAGFEPLCAWYSVAALPLVQGALERGERKVRRVVDELGASRLPLHRVAAHGDPAVLFLNVNTPEARLEAEEMAMRAEPVA